jgi:serine/threonine protein phosphatase PrpC
MLVRAEGFTDTGMVREHNEDFLVTDTELGLFAVADGMGGQLAGEIASRMAVDVLKDYIGRAAAGGEALIGARDERYTPAANQLASGIRLANRVIFEAGQSSASMRSMGSTIVAVLLDGDRLAIAHVGDSRVYLIRGGSINQITDDHSLVAEQQRKGLISKDEADSSHLKNVITRALGQDLDVEVDLNELDTMDGDRILLCSDGLTNMVSDEEILTVVTRENDPGRACGILVNKANDNGGKDNVTVVLVYLTSDGFFSGIRKFLGRGR